MTAKVTSKGRVTLPKAVLDLLGIKPGDVIDFERAPDGRKAKSAPRAGSSYRSAATAKVIAQ